MGFFGWVKPNRVLDGVAYEVKFSKHGKKGRTGTLTVSLRARSRAEFEVVRESNVSGFAKSIGLSKEIQIGDPTFDSECYIRTDSVRFTGALLQNQAVRGYIQSLLGMGFTSVSHDGEWIMAKKSGAVRSDQDNEQLLHPAVRALDPIAQQIANTRALGEDHAISGSTKGILAYSTGIGSLIAGFLLFMIGQSSYEPVHSWQFFLVSLNYSVTIFLIYAAVMFLLLKGRSRSHQQFLTAFFTSMIGIPLLTFGIMLCLNGRDDPGAAVEHDLVITNKYTTRSGKSGQAKKTKYHVNYTAWWANAGSASRSVSSADYNQIVVGKSRIIITTKPGKLGYEWVVRSRIQ